MGFFGFLGSKGEVGFLGNSLSGELVSISFFINFSFERLLIIVYVFLVVDYKYKFRFVEKEIFVLFRLEI